MRIKVIGEIISKTNPKKTNYHHGIYSMFINNLDEQLSTNIHNQNSKQYRLFTFSNVYIKNNKFHIYISGEDGIIMNFINNIQKNTIVRIEDMILSIQKIDLCKELVKKDRYLLKGKIIATQVLDGKKRLLTDNTEINNKLKYVSMRKLKELNIDGNIEFDVLKKTLKTSRYREGAHIKSYDVLILVSGDYEAIKCIYEVGLGENTSTGHGMMWEA